MTEARVRRASRVVPELSVAPLYSTIQLEHTLMNSKSFAVGFKVTSFIADAAGFCVDTLKNIPTATCDLGREVRRDAVAVIEVGTSFCAGMAQAVRVRNGKCALLRNEVRSNEEHGA